MNSKAQRLSVNSSNGFNKRLLRPVSNRPIEQTNLMRNSRVLNLRDSLSIKNKYAQVKSLIHQLHHQLEPQFIQNQTFQFDPNHSAPSKGIQYVKSKAYNFNNKKSQMTNLITSNSHNSGKKHSLNFPLNEKSASKILSQLQTQNLQDGIKLLYNEQCEITQIIQNLCGVISMATLVKVDMENIQNPSLFENINGDEDNLEYFTKLLGIQLNQLSNPSEKSSIPSPHENTPQPKFKPIFTAKDQFSDSQQTLKLKQQISILKKTISELEQCIQEYLKQAQTITNAKISGKIQKVHKQIQSIYDQAIKMRNNQIQKLRKQLNDIQQNVNKKVSYNDLMSLSGIQHHRPKQTTNFSNKLLRSDGSQFSCTVQEEFEKMRTGFMKKMEKLQAEFTERQQKLKKHIFNLEKNMQSLQWEKKLILKKYEFLLEDTP